MFCVSGAGTDKMRKISVDPFVLMHFRWSTTLSSLMTTKVIGSRAEGVQLRIKWKLVWLSCVRKGFAQKTSQITSFTPISQSLNTANKQLSIVRIWITNGWFFLPSFLLFPFHYLNARIIILNLGQRQIFPLTGSPPCAGACPFTARTVVEEMASPACLVLVTVLSTQYYIGKILKYH